MATVGKSFGIKGGFDGLIMDLYGDKELARAFDSFVETTQNRLVVAAVKKAGKTVTKSIRSEAPVDTGALKKSIGHVVRRYPSRNRVERVMCWVGARLGRKYQYYWSYRGEQHVEQSSRLRIPGNYAHLVEYGTAPHWISPKGHKGAVGTLRIGQRVVAGAVWHPGTPATNFTKKGWLKSRGDAQDKMIKHLRESIKKEARKVATKAK